MTRSFYLFLMLWQVSSAEKNTKTEISIYEDAIEVVGKIGKEWKLKPATDCVPVIEESPEGKRRRMFLARIPTGKQSLVLGSLPKHSHVRVQFDLILQGS